MAKHRKHDEAEAAEKAAKLKRIEGDVPLRVTIGFAQGGGWYPPGKTIHRSEAVAKDLVASGYAVRIPTDREALVSAAAKLGVGLVTTDAEVLRLAANADPVVATWPKGAAK